MMNGIVKDNRGLSLVELIVVIAIMVVLLGAAGFSIMMLTGAEAKQGVKKMEAQLNDVKTGTMTMALETLELTYLTKDDTVGRDTEGYYAVKMLSTVDNKPGTLMYNYTDPEYSFVANKRVEISILGADKDPENPVYKLSNAGGDAIKITFNRGSSAMTIESGAYKGTYTDITDNAKYICFKVGLREYYLEIFDKTGAFRIAN